MLFQFQLTMKRMENRKKGIILWQKIGRNIILELMIFIIPILSEPLLTIKRKDLISLKKDQKRWIKEKIFQEETPL